MKDRFSNWLDVISSLSITIDMDNILHGASNANKYHPIIIAPREEQMKIFELHETDPISFKLQYNFLLYRGRRHPDMYFERNQ